MLSSSSFPSSSNSSAAEDQHEDVLFEVDDYLVLTDGVGEEEEEEEEEEEASSLRSATFKQNSLGPAKDCCPANKQAGNTTAGQRRPPLRRSKSSSSSSSSVKVAFLTKSEMEILDDGYKWRKYGKKAVKSSPNPRNYYRCISEGCNVKKRVERHQEDPSLVMTTYEGVHNHHAPLPCNNSGSNAGRGHHQTNSNDDLSHLTINI